MSNIMVYGYGIDEGKKLAEEIHRLFEGKAYQSDYVVTVVVSQVEDHNHVSLPFLRIMATDICFGSFSDIIIELKKLRLDIEVVGVKKFIPKE
jgi:hypothetical protein